MMKALVFRVVSIPSQRQPFKSDVASCFSQVHVLAAAVSPRFSLTNVVISTGLATCMSCSPWPLPHVGAGHEWYHHVDGCER